MSLRLRFLHTADWHLGQPYRSLPPGLASRLREERLSAVGRLLSLAERQGVNLVLAAGDQFDGPNPDPDLVREVLGKIAEHPGIEVHLIPGNHDPGEPGSIYRRALFEPPPNLRVHLDASPVPLPERGATLYPCPCDRRSGDDPLSWIGPRRPEDGLRIALAHGSLPECLDPEGRTYPIPADAPTRYDLDYVALGDWHTARPAPEQHPTGRMYYAGAPEVGGWDEVGAGSALLVDLGAEGEPAIRRLRCGGFRWDEITVELYADGDVLALNRRLDPLKGADRLVRLRVSGRLSASGREGLDRLIEERAPEFAALLLRDEALVIAADGDLPEPADPMLREALARLVRLRDGGGGPAGEPPEVVSRAIELFRALAPREQD
ncbi:metallophosphoesterase family protein [Tautonia sociabilis]|uniref:DNA repair exonuclease n=1 Tax=Tautonia sociabilis TaxID=2080755 RepID=A0A432MMZ9_9BACT|nr:DNA repair exonuclease [Tautonia sociabilis]RUL88475.1 DNA repair exonuclease [Tautonia sociabilis]